MVDLLSDLVGKVVVTDPKETIGLPLDVRAALGDDRLASVMAKLRAHSVANRVSVAQRDAGFGQAEVIDHILGTTTTPLMPTLPTRSHGFNRFDPNFVYRYKQTPDLADEEPEGPVKPQPHPRGAIIGS